VKDDLMRVGRVDGNHFALHGALAAVGAGNG